MSKDGNALLILAGQKGSGKNETGKHLSARGLFTGTFDTGSYLRNIRANIASRSPDEAKRLQSSQLIGSDHVNPAIKGFLSTWEQGQKKILDGYPRKLEQAFQLLTWREELQTELNLKFNIVVVLLDAGEICAVERRKGRGEQEKREDDLNIESLANGIREFHEMTMPALKALQHNGIPLIKVSSETGEPDVKKSIAIVADRTFESLKHIEFI